MSLASLNYPYRDIGDVRTEVNIEIETFRNHSESLKRIRAVLDLETREGSGIDYEISKIQLRILNNYALRVDYSNLACDIEEEFDENLEQLREKLVAEHQDFLNQSEEAALGDQSITLTAERRCQLFLDFESKLDVKLEKARKEFQLDGTLEELDQRYHKLGDESKRIYESMREQEAQISDDYQTDRSRLEQLERLQTKLMQPQPKDDADNQYMAAQLGLIDLIKSKLIGQKDRVKLINMSDRYGYRMLDYAAFCGQVETVDFLLSKKANPALKSKKGYQPLHWACWGYRGEGETSEHRLEAVVRRLLAAKAPINEKGEYDRTPLHIAMYQNRPAIVRLLVSHRADPNIRDAHGATPIFNTLFKADSVAALQNLLAHPAIDLTVREKGATILKRAVEEGLDRIVRHILYHKNWKDVSDRHDPNFLIHLMSVQPKAPENRAKIIELIIRRFTELYPARRKI